jgi:uncharacterized membrane protein YfcA
MLALKLALSGLLVGGLVGLTGMGGGSLMTPLLVLGFGFNPTVAVGTDLLHGAVFKSVGAIRHRTLGTVQARLSGWMFLGSAPTSLLGVALATWLRHRYGGGVDSVGGDVLGGALVAGGLGLTAKSYIRYREASDEPFRLRRRDRLVAVGIGLFGGFAVGLTSVGSGVFFALTLLLAFPLKSAKVVGTDIFHAAALLWVAGLGHLAAGNVDLRAVGWLLLGSIPGVLLGSHFTLRVPERGLRLLLAVVLVLSGEKLLGMTTAVMIVAPVLLVAGAGWRRVRDRRATDGTPAPLRLGDAATRPRP